MKRRLVTSYGAGARRHGGCLQKTASKVVSTPTCSPLLKQLQRPGHGLTRRPVPSTRPVLGDARPRTGSDRSGRVKPGQPSRTKDHKMRILAVAASTPVPRPQAGRPAPTRPATNVGRRCPAGERVPSATGGWLSIGDVEDRGRLRICGQSSLSNCRRGSIRLSGGSRPVPCSARIPLSPASGKRQRMPGDSPQGFGPSATGRRKLPRRRRLCDAQTILRTCPCDRR